MALQAIQISVRGEKAQHWQIKAWESTGQIKAREQACIHCILHSYSHTYADTLMYTYIHTHACIQQFHPHHNASQQGLQLWVAHKGAKCLHLQEPVGRKMGKYGRLLWKKLQHGGYYGRGAAGTTWFSGKTRVQVVIPVLQLCFVRKSLDRFGNSN